MKTNYYLVLAAVVAAAGVTVYARLPDPAPPAPSVPLVADTGPAAPRLELPPVALPPEDTPPDPVLIAPRGANLPLPIPVPPPDAPVLPPVAPTGATLPVPSLPVPPKPSEPPALPIPPVLPEVPAVPAPPVPPKPVAPPAAPLPALPAPAAPKADFPPLPVAPKADLPPLPKPDLPAAPPMLPAPVAPLPKPDLPAAPAITPELPPALPVPKPDAPAAKPELPALPAPVAPLPKPELPALPVPSAPPVKPDAPVLPPVPEKPELPVAKPDLPLLPTPVAPPLPPVGAPKPTETVLLPLPAPTPVAPAATKPVPPQPLPAPTPLPPVVAPAVPIAPAAPAAALDPKPVPVPPPGTKFVLLKGDRLLECGSAVVTADAVVVKQGALDRALPKAEVQFVGDSRDAVYKFVLARVPAADPAARLQVARWCMYVGMREQALAEAREVLKLDPKSGAAADLIRSLELSLKQFPPADAPKMAPPERPTFPAELRPVVPPMAPPAPPVVPPIPPAAGPDTDVPASAARTFAGTAHALLQNKCAECHARGDHSGPFKLVRVDLEHPSEHGVRANLRAVAEQLAAGALLEKARTAHGNMKEPALSHLDRGYKALSAWAATAHSGTKPPAIVPTPAEIGLTLPEPTKPDAKPESKPADSLPPVPPVGGFGTGIPPKAPPTGPSGDEFDPAGYNREK